MNAKRELTFQPTYTDGITSVVFVPESNVPGHPYKVLVIDVATRNLIGKSWMGEEFRPSQKTALFFMEKFNR